MKYDGFRFRAECKLAGKVYGSRFGVDVAFGDPIFGEPDIVVADDLLAFVGIASPALRVYPVETHVAEKLHAYTMPREHPNSRVKDLPDIAWSKPYEEMAREDHLSWTTLHDVTKAAQAFLDPVLVGTLDATWEPAARMWRVHR